MVFANNDDKNILNSLNINPNIDIETQNKIKELFNLEYLTAERPEFPHVKTEFNIKLTIDRIICFNPRRLSFEEKAKLDILECRSGFRALLILF